MSSPDDDAQAATEPPEPPRTASSEYDVPSQAIRSATYKIIDLINEQCMRATTQIFGERKTAIEAYNDLHREHMNFRRNVNFIVADYKQRVEKLQYELDQAVAERDRLLEVKGAMANGVQMMIQKIEDYNEDLRQSGLHLESEGAVQAAIPDAQQPTEPMSIAMDLDQAGELDNPRKLARQLQKQNELLMMQVCTAEAERVGIEDGYKRRIAELEDKLASL